MAQKETAIEVKVGALVLFSLALLVAFVLALGDFSFGDGFTFQVEFNNAGGLKPGADVAIAGINVGKVESLRFNDNPTVSDSAVGVTATLSVDPDQADAIRQDSDFFITTRGVLGEPYIEIVTRSLDSPPIENGATLRGVDPPRMDIIVAKASELLTSLTDLLDNPEVQTKDLIANTASLASTLDGFLKDNRSDLDQTVDNVRDGSDEARKLLAALNVAVDDGKGIQRTLSDVETTAANARRITSKVDGKIDPVLDDVTVTAENARKVTESADRLIVENEPKIAASINNVETSTARLASLSEDAQGIVQGVKQGDGTVGALLTDREVYDDLKEMLRIIKQRPWKIVWKE
jgi:phospholipid/cholesterol/gamma-HCH transport system substrate-binding protein